RVGEGARPTCRRGKRMPGRRLPVGATIFLRCHKRLARAVLRRPADATEALCGSAPRRATCRTEQPLSGSLRPVDPAAGLPAPRRRRPRDRAVASPALTLVQPMQSLPSLLALADLRRQASTAIRASREMPAAMAELLALDPLTVLRAMRLVCAPVHGRSGPPRTVREIVDLLGTKAVGRLLTVPGVDEERTRRIRVLWRRTVARACAAELLAR